MSRTYKAIVWLCIVASIVLTRLAFVQAETISVSTFDGLRKATTQPAADVIIVGTIKCPDTITVTSRTLRLTADKQTSGLDFASMPIAPNWGYTNGLDIHSDNATLYGLTIKNFQARGGCVKFYGFGLFLMDKVTFSDVSTTVRPQKMVPAKSADDAHYANCIASHGTAANVIVTGCTFRRCVWTAHAWSHCIYVTAGNVVVTDNLFEGTGNPMTIDGQSFVSGNKVVDPVSTPTRWAEMQAAYLATIRSGDRDVYIRNVLSGAFCSIYAGSPNPATHFVDWNDYSGVKLIPPFASDTSKAVEISADTWKKMGFDQRSKWP